MFIRVGQQENVTPGQAYPLVRADAGPSAVNGLGGCGCTGIRSVGRVDPAGLGVNPDGLGDTPFLFSSVTGSSAFDAVLGGAIGWMVAPHLIGTQVATPTDRMLWAAGGAAAAAGMGGLGILALVVGAGIYVSKR